MHVHSFGKAVRSCAFLLLTGFGLSHPLVALQANHEYVPPNPQRYQQRPTAVQQDDYSEPVGNSASSSDDKKSSSDDKNAPAPKKEHKNTAGMSSAELTTNEIVDFLHEHMVATFLCMIMIAPLWAMFGMRKTNHPYDH